MGDLAGKVALVTGASRGIGAAIAQRLAADGAAVAVNYMGGEQAAQSVVQAITSIGGTAEAFQADVSDPAACSALVEAVIGRFGRVDVLVNNAGITRDGLIMRMSDDDWDAVIRTNLTGAFSMTRAVSRPMMKQRTGSIVNVSSVVGIMGNAGQANYAAAKAGIIGLTKTIARELASRGVRANCVAPGFIETDMTGALSEDLRESARSTIAMARFGTPEEIASVVAFLASEDAAYVTGQTIAVDGGMTFA